MIEINWNTNKFGNARCLNACGFSNPDSVKGSVLMELLIMSVFFALLVEGMTGFGFGYRDYGTIVDAARAAGRTAAGYTGTGDGEYICTLARTAANEVLASASLNPGDFQITIQSEDLNNEAAIGASVPAIRITVLNQNTNPLSRFFLNGSATSLFSLESRNTAVGGC